jgi:hypothetical protein
MFNSEHEKVKFNYMLQRKERSMRIKGFTNNEIESAKNFID